METISLELSGSLKQFADRRAEQGGFESLGEYVRELIRLDQRQTAQSLLEAELIQGVESGVSQEMTADEWDELRNEVGSR
ncbi:MAG: type II toxin-antitoxin system ParD family antitoxin [Planctomycetaceae bacterium]|nr:type II toxin-antitoxin system ParD family antitoxin [Planctomycetaceae bacterium]